MKIAAYFNQGIYSGGGFQQSLNAALLMQRICKGLYGFSVYTPVKANIKVLEDLGLPGIYSPRRLLDRFFSLTYTSQFFGRLCHRFGLLSSFERTLIKDGVDLVYFLAPSDEALHLQQLNYIFTVWDLCHRDFPEFPEVRSFDQFTKRESIYRMILPKAFCVIADSDELKNKIVFYYSIAPDRISMVPFQPGVHYALGQEEIADQAVLQYYDLKPGYLFYPAQFWPHKGHVHLLEALATFQNKNGYCPSCVFSGSDKGNLHVVSNLVRQFGLSQSVRLLGFVPSEHIPGLYRSASALVMPTYFGPTNLPPLEALSLGVPVIYPGHLSGQCGDAAIYFDVDDPVSLCDAIEYVLHELDRKDWLTTRSKTLTLMEDAISLAEKQLRYMLQRFEKRLVCWQSLP